MTNVSRPLRAGLPAAAALAIATAVMAAAALPASAGELAPAAQTAAASPARVTGKPTVTEAGEWWLPAIDVAAAWRAAPGKGKGVTVAVLSTGVDPTHPDLTGTVTTGPVFADTGRKPGQQYWGDEGTAVASLIAGHGHGAGDADGITGIAPGARILSVQVTLEYDDPINADAAVARGLPDAIAAGIRYAVGHGATVIALPLDPGALGAIYGDSAAAGGSQAERSAVEYAVSHDVLLIAPAGDNGAGGNAINYPAGYPGVIAVGATARAGGLAPFTNTGSYVALTAPGADAQVALGTVADEPNATESGLTVAAPDGGYQTLASTDMASALTSGVAALIRGRYPWLTAAEVTQAIEDGATAPHPGATAGHGHGALNAANALSQAAAVAATHPQPTAQATPEAAPPTAGQRAAAPTASPAAAKPGSGTMVRSVLLDMVVVACVLIACLIGALAVVGFRRRGRSARSAGAAAPGHARGRARHARANEPPPTIEPLQGTIWPQTPARPAIGTGVWSGTTPSARPAVGRPADAPLAPWEQSPAAFAAAPTQKSPPPWPLSSTGPMYIWNPAATSGPFPALEQEENQDL